MKLAGNFKGKIFPESTINVYPADYRYGADYAYSHATDNLFSKSTSSQESRYQAELWAYKHNIPAGAFINNLDGEQTDLFEFEKNGRGRLDIYFPSDRWKNPDTGDIEVIPDYYEEAWTTEGETYFNVTAGEPKNQRRPNHGQQLYDISGGKYGYDVVNEVMGQSNLLELNGLVDSLNSWFRGIVNRDPTTIAYRNGRDYGGDVLTDRYLAGRNSGYDDEGNGYTHFGKSGIPPYNFLGYPANLQSRRDMLKQPSTVRWRTLWMSGTMSKSEANTYVENQLQTTANDRGHYHNFHHWHFFNSYNEDLTLIEEIFSVESSKIDSITDFCWRTTYGEAFEYFYIRDSVNRIGAYENSGDIYVTVDLNPEISQLKVSNLKTPLTLILDTTGTALEGSDIKCSSAVGIRKISANKFAIDVDFEGFKYRTYKVQPTTSHSYYNFSLPSIISITEANNTITVETDRETKLTLFYADRGTGEKSADLLYRSLEYKTIHKIDVDSSVLSDDIWAGVITNEGQSILSSVQQFA